jgi:hypothetical protein
VKNKISGITVLSLTAALFVLGCGTSTEKTTKETSTTTYVPAAAPQVIVQAPPVAVVPPPVTTTTTSMTNDRATDSTKSGFGTNGTEQNTTSHHSESTTVTPSN